jgi:hypothetical protein
MDFSKFKKFNDYFNSFPKDYLIEKNEEDLLKNEKEFKKMKKFLDENKCSYCGHSITFFLDYSPCFHWLLAPKGFKAKKHLKKLYTKYSFHQIEAYLRWLANCEKPFQNINDLVEEKSKNKFIETTIKYKNYEWSFSCSDSDFTGHKDSKDGELPHYHFQMKINNNVVIKFNSFHIPFNEHDEFCFAVKQNYFDLIKGAHIEGAGMETLISNIDNEDFIDSLKYTDDVESATFNTQVLVMADEGKAIKGEDIAKLLERQKNTGESMAKLVKSLKGVKIQVIVTPGKGVPDISKRSPRKPR